MIDGGWLLETGESLVAAMYIQLIPQRSETCVSRHPKMTLEPPSTDP